MPQFSKRSNDNLLTCDERLQYLCLEIIPYFDFGVICGHRDAIEQNKLFDEGKSQLKWPNSKHNSAPSKAVDIVPYHNKHYTWNSRERLYMLAGWMFCTAERLKVNLRWGGDWRMDGNYEDNGFDDLYHWEII